MTRDEKIKLLQGIKSGKLSIGSLLGPVILKWMQIARTDGFVCKEIGETRNKNNLPTEIKGRMCANIIVYNGLVPLEMVESEDEITF